MPKCTKFDFRWGSAPDPAGRAYSASPDHLAVLYKSLFTENTAATQKHSSASINTNKERKQRPSHITVVDTGYNNNNNDRLTAFDPGQPG